MQALIPGCAVTESERPGSKAVDEIRGYTEKCEVRYKARYD